VRFGLLTPIVTYHPEHGAEWEEHAGPSELARIATTADRLGYHHLTCSEHVAIPAAAAPVRGTRYYDPLATFGFLAAQTARIRFATHVLVLPYHLAGGRLILGVGVGTLGEEFALLGAAFDGRGAGYEDALRALRAAFGRRAPAYAGTHHRFDGLVVDPCGVQERIPIWLGGRSPRSLRRALVFGDGWDPFRLTLAELTQLLPRARGWRQWRERTAPLELVLTPDRLLDPTVPAERAQLADLLDRYRALGATVMNLRFRHRSLEHYLEQLAVFAGEIAPRFA